MEVAKDKGKNAPWVQFPTIQLFIILKMTSKINKNGRTLKMHLLLIERLNLTFVVRIIYLTVTYFKNVKSHFMAACFRLLFGLPTFFFHSRGTRVKKEKKV